MEEILRTLINQNRKITNILDKLLCADDLDNTKEMWEELERLRIQLENNFAELKGTCSIEAGN